MPDASVTYTDEQGTARTPEYIKERWQTAQETMEPLHDRIDKYRKLYGFDHYKKKAKATESRVSWPD